MSNDRAVGRWPVFIWIVAAMTLAIAPMPESVIAYRPDWVALTLIYWSMLLPSRYSVGSAWIAGLVLDVAQGTLFGQHALALCFVVYITVKFHLQIRVFPVLQMTATVFALLALYQFILFWVNGVAGINSPAVAYWGPVVAGTVIWPFLSAVFGTVRSRVR